jgi:chromatin remodeling complex protein RSC6
MNDSIIDADWRPPSEDIQRLFTFDNQSTIKTDQALQNSDPIKKLVFTDNELSKLPSTLAKIVRRTDVLLAQNEIARKSAIEAHNELKGIQTLIIRHAKKYLKDADAPDAPDPNKSSQKGFRKPCKISDAMCAFMETPAGTSCSRVEVNNYIHNYIKVHKLTDSENSQIICPDDKLWTILSENARGNKITYFSIQKYIKHHFLTSSK